jgi:5'-methylthioadenosine phosphorylase
MVTDYDCWHSEHDAVEVTDILRVLQQNASNACKVIAEAVKIMEAERNCKCGSALAHALITDKTLVPANTLQKLEPIVGKYFV